MRGMYISAALLLVTISLPAWGQARSETFTLTPDSSGITYTIEVVIPDGIQPDAACPVAYCLDWFILGDYLKSLPRLMAMGRLTVPYILVGISEGGTMHDWATMRTRDFTPSPLSDDYSRENTYQPAVEMCGGAARFAGFLKNVLIPRIESAYPAAPDQRCLAGYSLGGLFGAYTLAAFPGLFQNYIIGSPSLWYNDFFLAGALEALSAQDIHQVRNIYTSVGADESPEMHKSYNILRNALIGAGVQDAHIKAEVITDAGHVGGMPISLYNGFRFIFQRQ